MLVAEVRFQRSLYPLGKHLAGKLHQKSIHIYSSQSTSRILLHLLAYRNPCWHAYAMIGFFRKYEMKNPLSRDFTGNTQLLISYNHSERFFYVPADRQRNTQFILVFIEVIALKVMIQIL